MNRKASVRIAILTLALFLITLAIPVTGALAEIMYGRVGTVTPTVKRIETWLSALDYNPGTVDYRFDTRTGAAVKAFQKNSGLPATGVVDQATYSALQAAYTKLGTTPKPAPAPAPAPAPTPAPTPAPAPAPAPAPQPAPSGLTAEESQLINLINSERTSRGLQPLQVDMRLVGTARAKAKDMAANRYFSHTSPTLGAPDAQIRNAGITGYTAIGENLAIAPSVSEAHTNLMNSQGHRDNILNSRFTNIGVGVISDSQWGKVVVEQFAGK